MNRHEAMIALYELESHFLRQALYFNHRINVVTGDDRVSHRGRASAYEAAADSVHRTIQHLSDAEAVTRMKDSEHEQSQEMS